MGTQRLPITTSKQTPSNIVGVSFTTKQLSPKVSRQQAEEIGRRLYSGKSNQGRSLERKKYQLQILTQMKHDRESSEWTFRPDTSLTRKRNQILYNKMKCRSQSRGRNLDHFISDKPNLSNVLFQSTNNLNINSNDRFLKHPAESGPSTRKRLVFESQKQSESLFSINHSKTHGSKASQKLTEFYDRQDNHIKKRLDSVHNHIIK